MNSRLLQFIQAENISQSQFADSIGVARASVSHILAGRNKPGFDFIGSMARRYPSLNVDWLVTGRGKMYKNAPESPSEAPARQRCKTALLPLVPAVKPRRNNRGSTFPYRRHFGSGI
jgi:transcriptional regulator with XRE-family HTH domain